MIDIGISHLRFYQRETTYSVWSHPVVLTRGIDDTNALQLISMADKDDNYTVYWSA